LFVTRGKSGLLRYISYPLICVPRDAFLSRGSFPRHPPPLPSPRRLLAVFVRLISRLSIPRPFPERIVERLEESASRSTAREKQTKLEEIAFAIVTRPLCRPPSLFLPPLSLVSLCLVASRFYAANSFSAGMKEKLRGRRDDRYQNEKISLQIYVFWAYPFYL